MATVTIPERGGAPTRVRSRSPSRSPHEEEVLPNAPLPEDEGRAEPETAQSMTRKKRRAREVCKHCHARKIRCDISRVGHPCSNCTVSRDSCVLRRRKNARKSSTTPPPERQLLPAPDIQHGFIAASNETSSTFDTNVPPMVTKTSWASSSEQHETQLPQDLHPNMNPGLDDWWMTSHLTDLDDMFAFTNDFLLDPSGTQTEGMSSNLMSVDHVLEKDGVLNFNSFRPGADVGLCVTDYEFLRAQGCFTIPQTGVLHQMMYHYFRMVHPNLPILMEDQIWARWNGDTFSMDGFSLLLLRAMMFAATSYINHTTVSDLGFSTVREARSAHYRQAKLLFDFGVESDPLASAQACLLLTYMSPSFNKLRVNNSWLTAAARFARIARADSYHRFEDEDPEKAKLLKRVWWGVLFRDRIQALGIRRSLQIQLDDDSIWHNQAHILGVSDFESELGQSPVYDSTTQLRVIQVLEALCKLTICLSSPLKLLYQNEGLDDRLDLASIKLESVILAVQSALKSLQRWSKETTVLFPSPVSLDDVHETLCLYINMMFVYYDSVVFALHIYLLLIHECLPRSQALFMMERSCEELQSVNYDLEMRIREIVQMRVMKDLPISATPLLAPSIILQAINVAAARGSPTESTEVRRLDVFTRALQSQQQRYDGSEFTIGVLNNIVACVQDDKTLVNSMSNWRETAGAQLSSSSMEERQQKRQRTRKLDWGNLISKRPKFVLRLMMHLDYAVCIWGVPLEKDFPLGLRKEGSTIGQSA